MELSTVQQIILVILASTLAIFLIVGIVIGVLIIKVMKHIRRITEKAEAIADKADSVTTFFQQSAGPAAIAKLISNIVHNMKDSKQDKRGKE